MPISAGRRPADDAAGFDGQTIHLPHETHAVIAVLQKNVALAIAIEIAGPHRMPSVCGRRPANDSAGVDGQSIHFLGETHAVIAILQENVARGIAIEIARRDRFDRLTGRQGFIAERHMFDIQEPIRPITPRDLILHRIDALRNFSDDIF